MSDNFIAWFELVRYASCLYWEANGHPDFIPVDVLIAP